MRRNLCGVILTLALALTAQTRVVMLGSGMPAADPEHQGPAAAVVVNGAAYLVDAGTGIVRQAAAAARLGHPELRVTNLNRVFITHLHSDHTLGYPDLILTPWVLGRHQSLNAYGPPGLRAMTDAVLQAWSEDIKIRSQGLEHLNPVWVRVNVHEIQPGLVYKDANVVVTAIRVHHGSWPEALGYRFQTADRVIVFSGDTTPVEALAQACNGCDLLFHEVYNPAGITTHEPDQKAYFAAFHTSPRELGIIATAARPKLLVLYHEMPEGRPESELLAQVQAAYPGPVVSARDLQVY